MENFRVIIGEIEATLVDCGDNVQVAWLDRLNNGFSALCEEFELLNEEEQAQNRTKFLQEQQRFHSIGATLISRLTKNEWISSTPSEDVAMVTDTNQTPLASDPAIVQQLVVEGAQSMALQQANSMEFGGMSGHVRPSTGAIPKGSIPMNEDNVLVSNLPYAHYMRLMRPLISMKPMAQLNAHAISEILKIIDKIQERATELNYSITNETRMIIFHIQERLDPITQHMWHFSLAENEPTLNGLIDFLVKREKFVAPSELVERELRFNYEMPSDKKARTVCVRCKGAHFLHRCPMFKELTLQAKINTLNEARLCINCFSSQHRTVDCKQGVCKKCNTKHNSLVCPKSN